MATRRESYFCSTVGRKQLVGLTGIAWALFVISHMLGNCLIFVSPEAYNKYGHAIVSNPLLPVAEIGLVVALIVHVYLTITLSIENKRARPQGYAMGTNGQKAVSTASKTMIYQGSIILAFVILHIITFKYGTHYDVEYDGVVMRDLARLMVEVFKQPGYVAWYLVSLVLLGMHLSHGVSSSFQTMGFNHPLYNKWIKYLGYSYAVLVSAGFIAQPLYLFLKG